MDSLASLLQYNSFTSAEPIELPTVRKYQLNGAVFATPQGMAIVYRQTIGEGYYYGKIKLARLAPDLSFASQPVELPVEGLPEDPRVVWHGDSLYITYTRLEQHQFKHYLNELLIDDYGAIQLRLDSVEQELCPPWRSKYGHEKNWVPFSAGEASGKTSLFFVYSIDPHTVVRWDLVGGVCDKIYTTAGLEQRWKKWGLPRGGTPAILTEYGYLSFFHSSIFLEGDSSICDAPRHYFLGAYLFDSTPPFTILASTVGPLKLPTQYEKANYVSPHVVIFPMGLLAEDDHFVLSYGDMDSRVCIVRIPKRDVWNVMVRIGGGRL